MSATGSTESGPKFCSVQSEPQNTVLDEQLDQVLGHITELLIGGAIEVPRQVELSAKAVEASMQLFRDSLNVNSNLKDTLLLREKERKTEIHKSVLRKSSALKCFSSDEEEFLAISKHLDRLNVRTDDPDIGTFRKCRSLTKINPEDSIQSRCYINPEGTFRLAWDVCSMALMFLLMIISPFELCFLWDDDEGTFLITVNAIVDIWFSIDIVLNFFTAYSVHAGSTRVLVTDPPHMAKRYLSGWFWIDLISTFPIARIVTWAHESYENPDTKGMSLIRALKAAKVVRMLKVLRALKLGRLMRLLEEHVSAAQGVSVVFQLLKLSFYAILAAHWTACAWYAVGYHGDKLYARTWLKLIYLDGMKGSMLDKYASSFYFMIATGTTVGFGDIHATNTLEYLFGCLLMICAIICMGHIIGRVGHIVTSLQAAEAQLIKAKRDAMAFLHRRQVSKALCRKVLRYIEHVHQKDSVTSMDTGVLQNVSEALRTEISMAVMGGFLKQMPLFEDVEDGYITAICQICRTLRAGAGDIMATEQRPYDELFLIVEGEVLLSTDGVSVGYLSRLDWFGELGLFETDRVHNVTIKCETECEFIVMNRKDLHETSRRFPKVRREYIKLMTQIRFERMEEMQVEDQSPRGMIGRFTNDSVQDEEVESTTGL